MSEPFGIEPVVPSGPKKDVLTAELIEIVTGAEGVAIPEKEDTSGRIGRFSGIELVATIVSSGAAFQLALALRDYVRRHKINVKVFRPDGTAVIVDVSGTEKVDEVVKFLDKESAQ